MNHSLDLPKAAKIDVKYHCDKNTDALFESAMKRLDQCLSAQTISTDNQPSNADYEKLLLIDGVRYSQLVAHFAKAMVKLHQSGKLVTSAELKKNGFTSNQILVASMEATHLAVEELRKLKKQKQKSYYNPKTGAKHYAH